ncbi:MAG TPA: hypothetical protein PLR01_13535 [Bacteroidales bacterium]|nr:hypothetical protein [Bacteroidales bacterium]
MKEVISWMLNFIEDEFMLMHEYHQIEDVTDEMYSQKRDAFGKYFHSLLDRYEVKNYSRNKSMYKYIDLVLKDRDTLLKRKLFQIKHYKNPIAGKELSSHIDIKDMYRCYLGPNQQTTSPDSRFSRAFFVSDTSEGLKIIYYERFTLGKWEQPHDYEPMLIKDFGTLVEVKKIQAPEEPQSLKDYNKE